MKEQIVPSTAAESTVVVDLTDECGAPLSRIGLDRDLSVGELASQAAAFDLPPGEDYALYRVATKADGTEAAERLAPGTRLGDISTEDDKVVRLRFAPALRGA